TRPRSQGTFHVGGHTKHLTCKRANRPQFNRNLVGSRNYLLSRPVSTRSQDRHSDIMRKQMLFIIALAIISNLSARAARNNILLVIADDYGTDSNSLYNTNSKASLPPTPNINSLYTNGVL